MSLAAATEALAAAYDARDVAEAHAVAEVRRQYAAIIARRVQEYQDAVRWAADDEQSKVHQINCAINNNDMAGNTRISAQLHQEKSEAAC